MYQQKQDSKWSGKRYVNLLRCSSVTQADTSPDGQKAVNDQFALNNKMHWVDDIYAEGVSGSQTFNRQDIEELVQRKRERNDFDVVIVYELGRLTRGGIRHGNVVVDQMKKAGITVLSSTEIIPDGPEGDMVLAAKHYANQLQARNISQSVARGLAQSLEQQTRPAASRTPYGLDRLFRNAAGVPTMLIRWDGKTQICFRADGDGKPLEEVARYVKPSPSEKVMANGRKTRFFGYRKQPDETSQLIPGSQERCATLKFMFTAYDVWKWGYHKIAKDLNDRNVPAAEGGPWAVATVCDVLHNPIYLGIEVRHRFSRALYNKLSARGPVPVSVDQDKLESENRKTVPTTERPRSEWRLVDVPALKELLPIEARHGALERISRLLDPDRVRHPRFGVPLHSGPAAKHRHMESPYLLTHLLHCKQTGHWMRGDTVNKKMKVGRKLYRYYFDGSAAVFARGDGAARRVPAEPLENAVMDAVWDVLRNVDGLEDRIRHQIETASHDDAGTRLRDALLAEQLKIQQRVKAAYKLLGDKPSDALNEMLGADIQRLDSIERELNAITCKAAPQTEAWNVEAVLEQLRELPKTWRQLSNRHLKLLLAAVVEDMSLDIKTLELTFTLVVPEMLTLNSSDDTTGSDLVRPASPSPWQSRAKTNQRISLEIDVVRCVHEMKGRAYCYTCHRGRPAA